LDQDRPPRIDLAPMLDTGFNQLLFFLTPNASTQETGVSRQKPQAVTATRLENDFILIAITPTGEVWHNRNNIGVAGVRSTVAALLVSEERPVVIQADRRATTDVLVRVLDEAKLAGAKSLNIATTAQ